jgi:hypothetical protein
MPAAPSTPSLRARRHQMTAGEALIATPRLGLSLFYAARQRATSQLTE